MKAAVLEDKGLLIYQDTPTPTPRAGHVRMKVEAVSICGSDIKRYVSGHRMYPLILGHECAGVIDCVGENVRAELTGRHAVVIPLVPCFECRQCKAGFYSACHSYSFIGSREAGGFAEYVELPERNVLVVPDDLPFEYAALVEPSTVARHMLALADFQAGQSAIVLGAGSIGLMAVQWLRILGANHIFCADISDEKLAAARTLGAHIVINSMQVNPVDEVRKLTGDGVDLTLEATGVPQVLEHTIPITRPRGKVVCAGNQPLDKSLPMSFIENMMRRELSIIGCFMSYSAPFPGREWVETVQAIESGALNMETMISHRYPLSAAPAVFAKIGAHALDFRKIMLIPGMQGALNDPV